MAATTETLDFVKCLSKYEDRLLTFFTVRSKTPLELDETKVEQAFEKIASEFPKMFETKWPEKKETIEEKEGYYSISEKSSKGSSQHTRSFLVSARGGLAVASYPLSASDQETTIESLAKVLDSLKLVSPLLIDYADFKLIFEFKYIGNHHQKVLDVLFKGSCFGRMVNEANGTATLFNPEIYILHPEDDSLRFITEVRPRTSIEEIKSKKYDGDEIAAVCSAAKFSDFLPKKDTMVNLCENLKNECLSFLDRCYLKNVVELLASELGDTKDE